MRRTLALFAAVASTLLAAAGPGLAEPNASEVQSFRAIVADYSKTSGGYSPAMSSDGKTVAFTSSEGDIWILPGVDLQAETSPEPWRLTFTSLESAKLAPSIFDLRHARNLDWSPDGTKLAFAYLDGRLYVADSFDFDTKTARVRAFITGRSVSVKNNRAYALGVPRWSPDGNHIACVRELPDNRASVLVVDLASGSVNEIATDAIADSRVWTQPWSPDSSRLAYGSEQSGEEGGSVVVLSLEGRNRRRIPSDTSPCPSWSLVTGKLAFALQKETPLRLSSDLGLVAFSSSINLMDKELSQSKLVTKPGTPTSAQTKLALTKAQSRLTDRLLSQFGPRLTNDQQSRVKDGSMNVREVSDLICLLCARKTGGTLGRLVGDLAEKSESHGSIGIKTAMSSTDVPQREKDSFLGEISALMAGLAPAEWHGGFESDSRPVFSPDGSKIAFVRASRWLDRERLCVVDLATGREREVFRSREIECVGWSPGGKLLLLQSRRLMGVSITPVPGSDSPRRVATPGYPEIWMLQIEPGTVAQTAKVSVQQASQVPVQKNEPETGPRLKTIYLCPGNVGLPPGGKQRFQVIGLDQDGNEMPITNDMIWSIGGDAGRINADGTFTAGKTTGIHKNTVRVTTDGMSASATVEVLPAKPNGGYMLERVIGGSVPGAMNFPTSVTVDAKGYVYVADYYNNVIQKFDSSGKSVDLWGGWGREQGQMRYAEGVAVDRKGTVYTTELDYITAYDSSGQFLRRWHYPNRLNAQPDATGPSMVICDRDGNLYITYAIESSVLKYDPDGKLLNRWGSKGAGNGQLRNPQGIAMDSKGFIYVVDTDNDRVQKFDASGKYIAQWGSRGSSEGQFAGPVGVAIDSKDRVFVTDAQNARIQVFDTSGNFIRTFGRGGKRPGEFSSPKGIAIDPKGNVVVVDSNNCRVQRLSPEGTFLAFCGIPEAAKGTFLAQPDSVVADNQGNVYVGDNRDGSNSRAQKFDSSGTYISTLSGGWLVGVDNESNCYTILNSDAADIVRSKPSGEISDKFKLSLGGSGNRVVTDTIAFDDKGYIWALLAGGLVLKTDATGAYVSSFTVPGSADGDGKRWYPWSINADSDGGIYVSYMTFQDNKRADGFYKFDQTGKVIFAWKNHEGPLAEVQDFRSAALDGDNNIYLLGGIDDNDTAVFKLDQAGKLLDKIVIPDEFIRRIAVSPDGRVCMLDAYTNKLSIYASVREGAE